MQTHEIERVLRRNPLTRGSFRGVFASDILPNYNVKPGVYIINFDPLSKPGIHWIAVHVIDSQHVEYFDSYAIQPFVPNILIFLSKFSSLRTNPTRLQNYKSDLCGEYCCLYTLFKSTKRSLSQFIGVFSHPHINDCKVAILFAKFFGKVRSKRKCHPKSQVCCSLAETVVWRKRLRQTTENRARANRILIDSLVVKRRASCRNPRKGIEERKVKQFR